MSGEGTGRIPPWMWALAAVATVGGVALLASRDRRPEPPQSFRYEMGDLERVDPASVIFSETAPIEPEILALHAVAATPDGRIYAAGEGAVAVCDLDGALLGRYAVMGTPTCMAVAPDGEILLGMTDRIAVIEAGGAPKADWTGLGDQAHVTAIVADAEHVYVADAGNRVVLCLDRQGNPMARIGEEDAAKDIPGLIVPSPYFDVALDDGGALWAVNPGRHGLESYRPNGELITAWYRPSMEIDGFCGCCNPCHVAFRPDGTLVTAEKGIARVKLYSVERKLLGVVAGPEAFRGGPTEAFSGDLHVPFGDLAVDARGRVLVIDVNRNAIRVFEEKEPA
ncbi:MAG: NHL repeat-containing protein [Candidatus Hydrogenedentes bacterium]|nr:NHL repeat-containing protein [Candidatus Hydrogenedentota bacterium]